MKRLTLAIALLAGVAWLSPGAALATDDPPPPVEQVCRGLDSGKIDTTGDPATVTVTAPEGKLINGYCVKAGSAKQGDGPVYVRVDPAVKTITFGHPSGKDVSHYSVSYTDAPTPPTPEDRIKVTYTDWVGEPECDQTEYTRIRGVTTETYSFIDGEWVLTDTKNTRESEVVQVEEVIPCPTVPPVIPPPVIDPCLVNPSFCPPPTEPPVVEPPVVEPPVVEPPVVEPPVVEPEKPEVIVPPVVDTGTPPQPPAAGTPEALPVTGTASWIIAGIAALLTAAGATLVYGTRRRPGNLPT